MTVGRSTDRSTGSSVLAEIAANGYIFLGTINTPLVASFLGVFEELIFPDSLVFSQQSKEVFGI